MVLVSRSAAFSQSGIVQFSVQSRTIFFFHSEVLILILSALPYDELISQSRHHS
jgi:hypothetical protein